MPALEIPASFKRRLDKKGKRAPALQAAVLECVVRLGQNPRHPGLHTHKVEGRKGVFESYVDDANRVTWQWGGRGKKDCIVLLNHCNHDIVGKT